MAVTARDVLPEHQLRESYLKHAARAQLYRLWGSIADGVTIDDLFEGDQLDSTIDVAAVQGALPRLDDNRFDIHANGEIKFVTTDDSACGTFAAGDPLRPRLSRLRLAPSRPSPNGATFRVCAAVHYFIALVENPARLAEPFHELLGADFSLGYTEPQITDLEMLGAWVRGALSSVIASEHDIHSIDVERIEGGRLTTTVRMTSQARFPDGSGAISRNAQTWTLEDRTRSRLPLITRIEIARDAVEFFGPPPLYEPRTRS